MPISPKLTSMVNRALSNNILSNKEAKRIYSEAKKDGVSTEEVNHIVGALAEALGDGLELDTTNRKKRINNLLAKLEAHHPLGLDESSIDRSSGAVSYLEALIQKNGPTTPDVTVPTDPVVTTPTDPVVTTPTDPVVTTPTDPVVTDPVVTTPTDPVVTTPTDPVVTDPAVTAPFTLDLAAPTEAGRTDALNRVLSGELAAMDGPTQKAAVGALLDGLEAGLGYAGDDDQAFLKHTTATASLGALLSVGEKLTPEGADRLLALYAKAPAPMAQTLILGALEKATLNDTQKAALGALEAPEHKDVLLQEWNDVAGGTKKLGYSTKITGDLAALTLSGLAYCKKPDSMKSLYAGIEEFKDLNAGGSWDKPFDADEIGRLSTLLSAYTQKHDGLAYVFGTWKSDAPKHKAVVTNKRVQDQVLPQLDGTPPKIGDIPLHKDQVDLVKSMLGGVADDRALGKLKSALREAAFVTNPSVRGYRGLPTPTEAMSPTSREFLKRFGQRFIDEQGGTKNGMIDVDAMVASLKKEGEAMREVMQPRLAELSMTPGMFAGVALNDQAKATLKMLLTDHSRSPMSVGNIELAVKMIAAKNGGAINTPDAANVLDDVVIGYMSNWPEYSVFDFNKLERIAKFKADGKDVPLCSINGVESNLAEFYTQVASGVTAAIDRTPLRHEWMAHRWGNRAKESVELLDVIAEKTSQGDGPVVALQTRYPGKTIEVQATGLDGAHQQFLFAVKDGDRTIGVFNQGSDGNILPYRDSRKSPILFSAEMNTDGSFDVQIEPKITARRYPIQTTYGIGDSLDIPFFDSEAIEVRTEGESFDTKYKIVEGKIEGFDPSGDYVVSFTKPDGTETTETYKLDELRKTNHPHYFSETGSYIRDMEINFTKDPDLKAFLEEADPMIQRHLPTDGSMATMSPREVARRQKAAVDDIMKFCDERMKYPNMTAGNDKDARYRELNDLHRFPLGELLKIGKGQCRHQCIIQHLLLQRAGIDSRLASGSANTSSGDYRGLHLWVEINLANDDRYLSDQTWKDEAIPLWNGAYDVDKRRTEIYNRTDDFDRYQAA